MKYLAQGAEPILDVVLPADRAPVDAPAPFVRDLNDRYTPTWYLHVGNVCNLACRYCSVERRQARFTTLAGLAENARGAAARGLRKVVLIGGEPTIRKDLPDLLAVLRQTGHREIVLTTNGLVLALPEVLDGLVAGGLTTVHLSLDSFDPDLLADLLQEPRAPALLLQAFENLMARADVALFLYAVVTRPTLPSLVGTVRRIREAADRHGRCPALVLAALKPQARALDDWDALVPHPRETAAAIGAAIDEGDRLGVDVAHIHLPPCLLPARADRALAAGLAERRLDLATGLWLPAEQDAFRVHGEPCAACTRRPDCTGIFRPYAERLGWDWVRPL